MAPFSPFPDPSWYFSHTRVPRSETCPKKCVTKCHHIILHNFFSLKMCTISMCFEKLGLRYRYSGSSIFSVSRYLRGTTFLCIINVEPFRSTRSPTLLPPDIRHVCDYRAREREGTYSFMEQLSKKVGQTFWRERQPEHTFRRVPIMLITIIKWHCRGNGCGLWQCSSRR